MTLPPHRRYQEKLFPGSSHWWALEQIQQLQKRTHALDIGSGSGVMGRRLKELGWKQIFAVEIDDTARAATASYYDYSTAALNDLTEERFNLIFLLDVLEHSTTPEELFAQAVALTAPGGTLLVSVPNIAHWSIRLRLLMGNFQYQERGLLDRTHVQFFTHRRLKQLVDNHPELANARYSGSIEPVELVLPPWLWDNQLFEFTSRCRQVIVRLQPRLLAYQHLLRVERLA